MIIVKFWVQISAEEQLRRFQEREKNPVKRWKLTDEDWRNRDKTEEYANAIEEMFRRTNHELAPWHLVSGEQKKWARVQVLEILIKRIEEGIALFEHPDWRDGYG